MPEADYGVSNGWLTCLTVDPGTAGGDRESVRLQLERSGIEARPLWKPMHLQPVFSRYRVRGGAVSEGLFERGLCLPSGSSLTDEEQDQVIAEVRGALGR
jgi:dTDP-4-amino-4,6-dideoxygalactose transaminase